MSLWQVKYYWSGLVLFFVFVFFEDTGEEAERH